MMKGVSGEYFYYFVPFYVRVPAMYLDPSPRGPGPMINNGNYVISAHHT
jgi:hypothetical protein